MTDCWYYSHEQARVGPCSSRQLQDLAASGGLLPTDTIWKDGVEQGVLASKVNYLFQHGPPRPAVEVTAPAAVAPAAPVAAPAPAANGRLPQPARKGTATAGAGALLVGQDGVNVKFRKKCVTCGHSDSSWQTAPIRNGTMKFFFFCPKCRKNKSVEIRGSLS